MLLVIDYGLVELRPGFDYDTYYIVLPNGRLQEFDSLVQATKWCTDKNIQYSITDAAQEMAQTLYEEEIEHDFCRKSSFLIEAMNETLREDGYVYNLSKDTSYKFVKHYIEQLDTAIEAKASPRTLRRYAAGISTYLVMLLDDSKALQD